MIQNLDPETFIKLLNESEKYSDYQYVEGENVATKFKNKKSYKDGLHFTKAKYYKNFLKNTNHYREVLDSEEVVQLNEHIWKARKLVLGPKKNFEDLRNFILQGNSN